MGVDGDIASAIETQLAADGITTAIVQTTEHKRSTQVPLVRVDINASGSKATADLSVSFYRNEYPFIIEIRGSDITNLLALKTSVTKAVIGMNPVSNGWYEFDSRTMYKATKNNQLFLSGRKVLFEDES